MVGCCDDGVGQCLCGWEVVWWVAVFIRVWGGIFVGGREGSVVRFAL